VFTEAVIDHSPVSSPHIEADGGMRWNGDDVHMDDVDDEVDDEIDPDAREVKSEVS
jgi:hypothetical protein